jgi:hypothetical protein
MFDKDRKSRGFWYYLLWLALMFVALASTARGEDRALLIGVGRYAHLDNRLNGVGLDLNMMAETAQLMGFSQKAIRVLKHENATYANVRHEFKRWLSDKTGPNDRILIYFSGHGSQVWDQNQDETDGFDEVLLLYDTRLTMAGGHRSLSGVLHDDRFHRMLAELKSHNILVIVDACHSGSATRSLQPVSPRSSRISDAQVKYFYYSPRLPAAGQDGRFDLMPPSVTDDIRKRYVALTACRDDEKTIATSRGSIFTLALHDVVRNAAKSGHRITPDALRQQSTEYIRQQLRADQMAFHPQIEGHPPLRERPLVLVAGTHNHFENRPDLAVWVEKSHPAVGLRLNKTCFEPGDPLQIRVRIDEPGYLNIVSIAGDRRSTVLFPNRHHPQNEVAPGQLTIPSPRMGFELISDSAPGRRIIAAFLTRSARNGYTSGFRIPDNFMADDARISERSLVMRPADAVLAADKVRVEIREEGGCE